MTIGGGKSEAHRYGRRASLLSLAVGFAGLTTYVFFALASHNLGAEAYGELAVLWSAVFITVSVLQRPIELLLSRTISERRVEGLEIRSTLRAAGSIQLGMSLSFIAAALILSGPLEDRLLGGNTTLYWIGIGAVAAYGASYFARGVLAGSHRLSSYALLIVSESLARTAFPLAVALGVATGQASVALGIVAAPAVSLVVVLLAVFLHRRKTGGDSAAESEAIALGLSDTEFSLARGSRITAAVVVMMASEQTFLNAGPLLVTANAGAGAAGHLFNILMIARAPLQLFQAVATSLLPHLTRLHSERKTGDFRASLRATLLAVAGFAALSVATMAIAGPPAMRLAFGGAFDYDRVDLVIVTVGMGLYLVAATLNQAALAQRQTWRAAACWAGCAIAFVVWSMLPIVGDDSRRVGIGFLGAAGLLCALLFAIYLRPRNTAELAVASGSAGKRARRTDS